MIYLYAGHWFICAAGNCRPSLCSGLHCIGRTGICFADDTCIAMLVTLIAKHGAGRTPLGCRPKAPELQRFKPVFDCPARLPGYHPGRISLYAKVTQYSAMSGSLLYDLLLINATADNVTNMTVPGFGAQYNPTGLDTAPNHTPNHNDFHLPDLMEEADGFCFVSHELIEFDLHGSVKDSCGGFKRFVATRPDLQKSISHVPLTLCDNRLPCLGPDEKTHTWTEWCFPYPTGMDTSDWWDTGYDEGGDRGSRFCKSGTTDHRKHMTQTCTQHWKADPDEGVVACGCTDLQVLRPNPYKGVRPQKVYDQIRDALEGYSDQRSGSSIPTSIAHLFVSDRNIKSYDSDMTPFGKRCTNIEGTMAQITYKGVDPDDYVVCNDAQVWLDQELVMGAGANLELLHAIKDLETCADQCCAREACHAYTYHKPNANCQLWNRIPNVANTNEYASRPGSYSGFRVTKPDNCVDVDCGNGRTCKTSFSDNTYECECDAGFSEQDTPGHCTGYAGSGCPDGTAGLTQAVYDAGRPFDATCIPPEAFKGYEGDIELKDNDCKALERIEDSAFALMKGKITITCDLSKLKLVGGSAFTIILDTASSIDLSSAVRLEFVAARAFSSFHGVISMSGAYPALVGMYKYAFYDTQNTNNRFDISCTTGETIIGNEAFRFSAGQNKVENTPCSSITTTVTSMTTKTTTTTYSHTDHPIHWKQQYDGLCFITFKEALIDLHGKTSDNTPFTTGCGGDMDYFKTTSDNAIYTSERHPHVTSGDHEWDHWCFPTPSNNGGGGKTSLRGGYAYCTPATTEINAKMTQKCNKNHPGLTGKMCGCAKMQILKQDITVETADEIFNDGNVKYTNMDNTARASFLSAKDASDLLFDACKSELASIDRSTGPLFDLAGTNILTTTARTTTTVAADAGASKTSVIVLVSVAGIAAIVLLLWLYCKSKKSTSGRGMKSSLESVVL